MKPPLCAEPHGDGVDFAMEIYVMVIFGGFDHALAE
jgi:hypothetical protein